MDPLDLQKEILTEKEKRNADILEILRRRGPISRPDISKEMGVNVVTISNYVDNFIRHKVVCEKELDISDGGRRPELLDLDPKAGYIIGAGLNLTGMVGLLLDLKGNIVLKTQVDRVGVSVKEAVECLLEIISEVIRRSKDYDIKGIGIGIAGIIDKNDGLVRWPERISRSHTNYASVNLQLKDLIEKEFGLPTVIENDATAACFGEHWLQLNSNIKNVLFIFSGVGCGIMLNGQIYTGSQGCAGEPSICNHKEDQLFNCSMGNPCFLKRWEVDLGIVDEVKERLAADREGAVKFFKTTSSGINNLDLKSVLLAARGGDAIASSVLDLAAKRLGVKVAYLVNLFNPEVVVIGGGLEEAGDGFLNRVISTVKDWAFREATEDLKIVYSQLRENAVALGAASLVMQKVFARFW